MYTTSERIKLLVAAVFLTLVAPGSTQQFQQGQPCYSPENENGRCLGLLNCSVIANVFNEYPRTTAVQYLRAAQRSCGNTHFNSEPVVCCKQDLLPIQTTTYRNLFFPTGTPRPVTTTSTMTSTTTQQPIMETTKATATTTAATKPTINDSSNACKGPDQLWGYCKPLADCQPLTTKLLSSPSDATLRRFLRVSNKICNNVYSVVCCPAEDQTLFTQTDDLMPNLPKNSDDIPTKLLTPEDGCGFVRRPFKKIVGGTMSKIGGWPWIALLGYNDGLQTSFKCGGALITSRHVLTAAHCIVSGLSFARLGEHNLTTDTETAHVDVPIVKELKHPQFTPIDGHNDIALLYLERNVQFTPKITPICLPTSPQLRSIPLELRRPFVAGWGKTMERGRSAEVLQELQISVHNNSVCRDMYRKQRRLLSEVQFDDTVICAGKLGGGQDTCQGDSGGPLIVPETYGERARFFVFGVVSYGIGCGRPNAPGVYTRVSNFIEWIEQSVANTP